MMQGKGPAFFTTGNVDSYLNLQPVKAETADGNTGSWVAVTMGVAVAALVVVWLLVRRRRPRAEEG